MSVKQINENLEQIAAFPAMQPPADIPVAGAPGASAYQVAVAKGFQGTEAEWLESLVGAQGPEGKTGASGHSGPQGEVGAGGPAGEQGARGPEGPQGPAGVQGPIGMQGDQGQIGPVGATGATGMQGIQGERGATGETGPQGPQGMRGETGVQGPVGERGQIGPQGVPGLQGDQGPRGLTGDPGAQGPTGARGEKGDQGAAGATGARGLQGEQGVQGIQGPQGATGPQGIAGLNAFSVPTSRTIQVGTAYQAIDPTKPAVLLINLSAQASAALLSLVQASQKGEIVIGPTAASITNGSGTKVALYENTAGGVLVVGLTMTAAITQGYTVALPAGWYFGVNRTAGTNLAVASCFDHKVG